MTSLTDYLGIKTDNITEMLSSPKLVDWSLTRSIEEQRSSYVFEFGGNNEVTYGVISTADNPITALGFSEDTKIHNDPVRDFLKQAEMFLALYRIIREPLYSGYTACIIGQVFTDKDLGALVKKCQDLLLGLYTGYGKGD